MKAFADNCQACGQEENFIKLRAIKISSYNSQHIKVCTSCFELHLALKDYKDAAKLIVQSFDSANIDDPETTSPNVVIEPAQSLVQKAVETLKKTNPNYFVGVRKIVIAPESNYGHVESGPGKDPAIINLNLSRIQQEVKANMTNQPNELVEEAIVKVLAETIAHERGHISSFSPEKGFQGGEAPAEAEAKRVSGLIGN